LRGSAETAKREANKRHRAKVESEVLAAFVDAGLTKSQGFVCLA
jgi:hypothetical protein